MALRVLGLIQILRVFSAFAGFFWVCHVVAAVSGFLVLHHSVLTTTIVNHPRQMTINTGGGIRGGIRANVR